MTCTVGLAAADPDRKSLDDLIAQAVEACGVGRMQGGNRVQQSNADDASTRIEESDRLWVPRIKQALIAGKVEFAWLGGFTHVQARNMTDVVPLVMRDIDKQFHSVFIASATSAPVVIFEYFISLIIRPFRAATVRPIGRPNADYVR